MPSPRTEPVRTHITKSKSLFSVRKIDEKIRHGLTENRGTQMYTLGLVLRKRSHSRETNVDSITCRGAN